MKKLITVMLAGTLVFGACSKDQSIENNNAEETVDVRNIPPDPIEIDSTQLESLGDDLHD